MNHALIKYIDEKFYPGFENKWDDTLLRNKILKYLKKDYIVLDVGAGRGRVAEMNFKGLAKRIVGVDPDPRVKENPLIDEGFIGIGNHMSFFNDDMFDLVFCDNVLEHVEKPQEFYKEISRVLKPGGFFISKTPNKYYYVSIIAAMTPESFHRYINRKRGRNESDTFPTFYGANTEATQKELVRGSRLEVIEMDFVEGRPEYLRIFSITYIGGLLFERFVNFFRLKHLKAIIITVCRKY